MITQAATGRDCKSLVFRLRRCKSFIIHSLIAQQVEREAVNFDVTGSIPVQRVMDDIKTRLHKAAINTDNKELAQLLSDARSRIELLEVQNKEFQRSREEYRTLYGWGKGKDE